MQDADELWLNGDASPAASTMGRAMPRKRADGPRPLRAIGGVGFGSNGNAFKPPLSDDFGLRTNGSRRWNGLGAALGAASGKTLGVIDYTLAKRALLRDWRRGLLSRLEICDAHPELIRAARYLGAEAARPCPVCSDWDLRLLAYVFGDTLKTENGRAFEIEEGLSRAASTRGAACYVIEVCTGCSWNHVCEAFMARSAG